MKYSVRLATKTVEIHSVFDKVKTLSKEYMIESPSPDITLHVSAKDIVAESEGKLNIRQMPDLETLAVYRMIAEEMLQFDTFLMHGSVIASEGQSFMFTAPSGTGKSTHIRKWLDNLPNAFVVNGDKPLIIAGDQQPQACGTPWAGKENWQTNTIVPLAAIVLMERSEENEIHEISFSEAFPFLLRQTYQPKDTDKMLKTLRLLKSLDRKVRFYKFNFNNMKDDAFQVSYHELVEKQMD